jgi:hypothetical protein
MSSFPDDLSLSDDLTHHGIRATLDLHNLITALGSCFPKLKEQGFQSGEEEVAAIVEEEGHVHCYG